MSDRREQLLAAYSRLSDASDILKSVEDGVHKSLPTNVVLAFSSTLAAKALVAEILEQHS